MMFIGFKASQPVPLNGTVSVNADYRI